MTTGRRNARSKLISVRLPLKLINDLKELGEKLGRPYQAVMKEAVVRGLPIVKEIGTTCASLRERGILPSEPLDVPSPSRRRRGAS
jgi:hypothetical protein